MGRPAPGFASRLEATMSHANGNGKLRVVDPDQVAQAKVIIRLIRGQTVAEKKLLGLDARPYDWSGLASILVRTPDVASRPALAKHWVKNQAHLPLDVAEMLRRVLHQGELEADDDQDDDDQGEPKPFSLDLVDTAAFFGETYTLDWLAKGVLVADQMGVIGGPSKSLKTSILIDLAISLASGNAFLGRFPVPEPLPVALISGESGRAVIQANAKQVCLAKGISYEAAAGVSWGFGLPALTNPEHLAVLRKAIRDRGLKVAMIDPLYMSLLAGNVEVDAKNLYQMGPILDTVARTCLDEGCTPIVAHHFVKKREDPYGPAVLDDLAFSGIGQFVRQWMLLARRERYDPETGVHKFTFTYGGSAGHAGEMHLDIDTGQITEDLDQGRRWSVAVSTPSEGRAAREEREKELREAREAEKAMLADQRAEQTLLANVGKVVEAIRTLTAKGRAATASQIRDTAVLTTEKTRAAIVRAENDGRIELYTTKAMTGTGSRAVEAYRMVAPDGRGKS
jgi:replicative DNA helicase